MTDTNTPQGVDRKVIVITGASSGFGRGMAIQFAKGGAYLVLAARRTELLQEIAAECEALGARALPVPVDVSKAREVQELAEKTIAAFGRIDVWINNAGSGAIGRFEEVPLEDHIQVIDTDLLGTLYGSYFSMQIFRRQEYGLLINISSVIGEVPMPYYASYAAAKHGVNGLSAVLRQELKQNGIERIRVCTVMPASTGTPFFEHAATYTGREFLPTPPIHEPDEVIEAVVKLVDHPQDTVAVGSSAKLAVFAHHIAPGLVESQLGRKTHETLTQRAPLADNTGGNVHHPEEQGRGVKSGKQLRTP